MDSDRAFFDIERRDLDEILERTADIWRELRGARIFITGGTGFFGTWLLASLLWANRALGIDARACVLSRDPDRFRATFPEATSDANLSWCAGDVTSFAAPDGAFSHIIHAATDTNLTAHADAARQSNSIIAGTRHVLAFASRCGASKMLLTSSGAVYGEQPAGVSGFVETYRPLPDAIARRSAYGSAKELAESLCATAGASGKIDTSIARCFAFTGAYLPLDGHFAIGNFIRDALGRNPIAIGGDGLAVRSYLYAADLTAWLWTVLVRGRTARVYNVGSDAAISIRELADLTARALAPGTPVRLGNETAPGVAGSRYIPNIDRARSELGLDVWTALPEAVRRTGAWYMNESPAARDSSRTARAD